MTLAIKKNINNQRKTKGTECGFDLSSAQKPQIPIKRAVTTLKQVFECAKFYLKETEVKISDPNHPAGFRFLFYWFTLQPNVKLFL